MEKKNFLTKKMNYIITGSIIAIAILIAVITGIEFTKFRNYETKFVVRDEVVTSIEKFSKYSPNLKGTIGDSNIYIIDSGVPGPSMLIIGGTHPNEPSGQLTATVFLENVTVQKGKLFIITEANKSAYSHSQPQEGSSMYYHITTEYGIRTFKFGTRASNYVDQWPNPDVYSHNPSGQTLSSNDVRNLNRSYPGDPNGNFTEKIAWAITNCIIQNDITMTVDLHEASPEYLTINAIIGYPGKDTEFNNDSYSLACDVSVKMSLKDVDITPEVSPESLHGLSHRELGTYTDTLVFLCETSNASQGKLRGAFTEDLIITGEDKFYDKAEELGVLYASPVHINERVGRHVCSISTIVEAFNSKIDSYTKLQSQGKQVPEEWQKYLELGKLEISNIPSYDELLENGVGKYLL